MTRTIEGTEIEVTIHNKREEKYIRVIEMKLEEVLIAKEEWRKELAIKFLNEYCGALYFLDITKTPIKFYKEDKKVTYRYYTNFYKVEA